MVSLSMRVELGLLQVLLNATYHMSCNAQHLNALEWFLQHFDESKTTAAETTFAFFSLKLYYNCNNHTNNGRTISKQASYAIPHPCMH